MTLICQMSSILKATDVVRPELRYFDFTNSLTYTVSVDNSVYAWVLAKKLSKSQEHHSIQKRLRKYCYIEKNGHSTAMVIFGRQRERGEIHFRISMVLKCAQMVDFDTQDRPVSVPIQRTWLKRSTLPKVTVGMPRWHHHRS